MCESLVDYLQGRSNDNSITRDGSGDNAHYLHRDHLGSLTAITDALGTIEAERSYSEWGEATRIDNWNQTSASSSNTAFLKITDEAYTGQETLAFGLLHYNGRVYDSVVGQFLSADPFIASPFDPQNANRRSYVGNSPLSFVDPSGFVEQVTDVIELPEVVVTTSGGGGGFDAGWARFLSGSGTGSSNSITHAVGGGVGHFSGVFPNGVRWEIYVEEITLGEGNVAQIDTTDLAESIKQAVEDSKRYHQGLAMVQRMIFEVLLGPQTRALQGISAIGRVAWDRSTAAGERAAEYYAGRIVSGEAHLGDHAGLYLAALWTPDTAPVTAGVLSVGAGFGVHAGRPFWRYVGPGSNPNSPWLTRGLGWTPPYGGDMGLARAALQLPHMPNAVIRANVPWWRLVTRPRRATAFSEFGFGGGTEYMQWRLLFP